MNQPEKISILIADDHPSIRYGLKSILEDLDFVSRIYEAKNGMEVVELLRQHPVDLILMDIRMPEMNGIATTKAVKKDFPCVKIIAFSIHIEERFILEIIRSGASGYIHKESEREIIVEAIKTVMRGDLYLSKKLASNIISKLTENSNNDLNSRGRHDEDLRKILYLICHEKSSKEIADILCFSKRTVDNYRLHLYEKIGTKSLAGAVKYAIETGVYDDDILNNKFKKYITQLQSI
jgi:DNA-binding NarL/FixJ family response regulator